METQLDELIDEYKDTRQDGFNHPNLDDDINTQLFGNPLFMKALEAAKGGIVVEVGCYTARLLEQLSQYYENDGTLVVGLDAGDYESSPYSVRVETEPLWTRMPLNQFHSRLPNIQYPKKPKRFLDGLVATVESGSGISASAKKARQMGRVYGLENGNNADPGTLAFYNVCAETTLPSMPRSDLIIFRCMIGFVGYEMVESLVARTSGLFIADSRVEYTDGTYDDTPEKFAKMLSPTFSVEMDRGVHSFLLYAERRA